MIAFRQLKSAPGDATLTLTGRNSVFGRGLSPSRSPFYGSTQGLGWSERPSQLVIQYSACGHLMRHYTTGAHSTAVDCTPLQHRTTSAFAPASHTTNDRTKSGGLGAHPAAAPLTPTTPFAPAGLGAPDGATHPRDPTIPATAAARDVRAHLVQNFFRRRSVGPASIGDNISQLGCKAWDLGLSERAQTWGLDSRGGPFLLATDLREDDAPHSNLHWGRGGPSLGGKHAAGARALQVAHGGILAACTSDREVRDSISEVKARALGGNPGTEKAGSDRRGRAHRRERCSGSLWSRGIDLACT